MQKKARCCCHASLQLTLYRLSFNFGRKKSQKIVARCSSPLSRDEVTKDLLLVSNLLWSTNTNVLIQGEISRGPQYVDLACLFRLCSKYPQLMHIHQRLVHIQLQYAPTAVNPVNSAECLDFHAVFVWQISFLCHRLNCERWQFSGNPLTSPPDIRR